MSDINVFSDGYLEFEGKTYKCALGKAGIGPKRGEGDNITPVGIFELKEAFYRPDRMSPPKSDLNFRATRPSDGWCDDPTDTVDYNKLVTIPHADSHERLWRDDNVYDIVVVMGYNTDPAELGKGSSIFMHLARKGYSPTAGCVALNLPDMLELLEKVDPTTRIKVHDAPWTSHSASVTFTKK